MYEKVPINGRSPSPPESVEHWAPGTELIAKFSFAGNGRDDIRFEKNEILIVVSPTKDSNWYKARRKATGETGMIPTNYVKKRPVVLPKNMPWFHGKISRDSAEELLKGLPDGSFLVRESTNFPGDYTLCVAFEGKVEHYRVQLLDHQLTCDEEEFFDTLPDLIKHYTLDADGLCHNLTRAVSTLDPVGRDMVDVGALSKTLVDSGWKIPRHLLQIGDSIGKGEFGDVRVGWLENVKVAVKVLKNTGKMAESLLSEASLMTSLRHPNLVRLLGVVFDDISQLFMVTEFMPNGSLVDFLRTRGRLQVTKRQQVTFACDVCEAMAYLESKQLVHRDLAARNVLLDDNMIAKVSDFGLAKEIDSSAGDSSGKFPIKWTAPEALRHSPVGDVIRHIEKGYRMEPPEGCPPELISLMGEAWRLSPEARPSFAQMLSRLKAVQKLFSGSVLPS